MIMLGAILLFVAVVVLVSVTAMGIMGGEPLPGFCIGAICAVPFAVPGMVMLTDEINLQNMKHDLTAQRYTFVEQIDSDIDGAVRARVKVKNVTYDCRLAYVNDKWFIAETDDCERAKIKPEPKPIKPEELGET